MLFWSVVVPCRETRFLCKAVLIGVCALAQLMARAQTSTVTLAWDPSSSIDVASYNLYWGGSSHNYTNVTNVGNVTNAMVSGLMQGATYFFAATAVDSSGLESLDSTEVTFIVPSSTNTVSTNSPPPPLSPPAIALSAPANGASFTQPAAIGLTANVTANGHTINQVNFFAGTTLLGSSTVAPYSFSWNNAAVGTWSLTAQLVFDGSNTITSPPIVVSVTSLPAPWQTTDLGSVGLTGSASIAGNTCSLSGAGNISGSSDNFRFLYQTMSGDGEIRGEISSALPGANGALVGAMVRENLTTGARYAFMGLTPTGLFRWQRRANPGGGTSSSKAGSGVIPNTFVRLVRSGNVFNGYKSADGVTWTLVNSATISMAANVYVGWAVASGSTSVLESCVTTNVSVVP